MNIGNYLNKHHLQQMIDNGYVDKKLSQCGNFYLLDYTRSAQFDGMWNDITTKCRGLVVDLHDDTIVGMCIPKFHNITESADHHLKKYRDCIATGMSFVATEKMDGSFGNVWWDRYQQKWRCSTRGSFESDQALWATKYLDEHKGMLAGIFHNTNLIVEIIYPDNRVVVDYKDRQSLVLLTGYVSYGSDNTIEEMSWKDICSIANYSCFDLLNVHHFRSIDEIVAKCETLDGNHEGYVLRFENGFRCKIKGQEYCKLHKILCGLSTKAIWENIDTTKWEINRDWLVMVPEEFINEVTAYGNGLIDSIQGEIKTLMWVYDLSIKEVVNLYGGAYTKKEYVDVIRISNKEIFSKMLLIHGGKMDELTERIYKEHQPEFRKMTITGDEE